MLNWINFLHIYQPPNQDRFIISEAVKESYTLIARLLNEYDTKITLSFSGVLIEQLYEEGHKDVLEEYKKLIAENKIEIVGGAMYHPILPLIPQDEVRRQIDLNSEISEKIFGKSYKPKGFFLPEMAYSKNVEKIIKEKGFKWIILDEIHFPLKKLNNEIKYKSKNTGMNVLFRNRNISNTFPPEYIVKNFDDLSKEKYLITAQDGEVYGYKHKDDRGFYNLAFSNKKIKNLTVSEYLSALGEKEKEINIRKASWESEKIDLDRKVPYPLWNNPKNEIHLLMLKLTKLATRSIKKKENDPEYLWARKHLDRGLSSCYLWWASDRDFKRYAPRAWNPTLVEQGAKELLSSIRSLRSLNKSIKLQSEELFGKIRNKLWHDHWTKNES